MAEAGLEKLIKALIRTLNEQITVQETLVELMEKKRVAMRDGRSDAMVAYCRLEQEKISRLAELEKNRLKLVAGVTQLVDPQAAAPLKLGELAERLPEPIRGQLLVLRQTLVQRAEAVREESSVARRATSRIVKHMTGLVQTIAHAAAVNPTYSRTGVTSGHPTGLNTLNMTA